MDIEEDDDDLDEDDQSIACTKKKSRVANSHSCKKQNFTRW